MNLKKHTKPALIVIGLLSAAGLATAQFDPAWAGRHIMAQALIDPELEVALKHHFEKRFFNLIDASDDQKSKLDSLITKQMEAARPTRQKIRESLIDLSDMMADSSVSDDAIRKKVGEIRALRDELHEKRLDTVLQARAILTDEQKKIVSRRVRGILSGNPRMGLKEAD